MGFKKPNDKKKKKSKKKSSADREWAHEGGQQYQTKELLDNENGKKTQGRRRTQDRDERQRRGRNKIEIRKQKQDFIRKMSHKVSFNEILGLEDNDDQKESEVIKKRKVEPNPMKSSSQVYKKFKSFFVERNSLEDDGGSEENDLDYGDEESSDSNSDIHSDEEDVATKVGIILHDSHAPDDVEPPPPGLSHWYFSSEDSDNVPNCSSTIKVNQLELSSDWSVSISGKVNSQVSPFQITKVGDIPDLHMMWGHLYQNRFVTGIESTLLSYLSCYIDMFVEGRDQHNDHHITYGTLWHILGHTVNSRITVMKHDKYLKKKKNLEKLEEKSNPAEKRSRKKHIAHEEDVLPAQIPRSEFNDDDDLVAVDGGIELNIDDIADESVNIQDSGYTRPRVLILCPFRSSALEIVSTMRDIFNVTNEETSIDRTTIKNWEKFESEYSLGGEDAPPDHTQKPSDWQSVFKDNVDDDFKMGIQINPLSGKGNGKAKGVHMRLYTDFYHSDIILASPLGLRLILENKSSENKKVENDYLSSLEIIYLHQADVLYMQNWSHVEFIFQNCNQLPHNKSHATIDFTRIRPYFLDNLSKQHRQLIISTNFNDPVFNTLIRQECHSKSGLIKMKRDNSNGTLSSIVIQVKQIFNIVPTTSFLEEEHERFQYFCSSVLTPLLRLKQTHTLIVTPSYLHFVQVRNELLRREANVAFVSEYSRESEISRGRSQFFHGIKDIMLYSGRAHFFRRFRIRGARHLIFYSLPEYAHFYPEIVNLLASSSEESSEQTSCIVLCTKYEKMALERIIGSKRCEHMLSSGKTTFMFY